MFLRIFLLALSLSSLANGKQVDTYRPQLHYSVPLNWLNDPNGLVYLNGEYHLYYQYHPGSSLPGPKSWAHAVSPDLLHWTNLPVAIEPDHLGDIWSGGAVVDFSNSSGFQTFLEVPPIIAFFTQVSETQQQSIAYSNDFGRTFTMFGGNPVIPNPGIRDFRDPKVIRYENSWIMVLAAGDRVQFYNSSDLKNWEFLSDFGADPDQGLKGVWECPDLFPLTLSYFPLTVWVLLVSNGGGGPNGGSNTQYFIGDFDGRTFTSDQFAPLWMDWGVDNYASISFDNEPQNRRIVIGWMTNLEYANDIPTGDWRGQMTFPRQLYLDLIRGELRVNSAAPTELRMLENPDELFVIVNEQIGPDQTLVLTDHVNWNNPLMYLDLQFHISDMGNSSSISICFLNTLGQEVCTGYDHGRERPIFLDRERSGFTTFNPSFSRRLSAGRELMSGLIRFQIYVDVVAIELFVDAGFTTMTSLFYPDEPYTLVEIRHHALGNINSKLSLISGTFRGLNPVG